MENDLNEIIKKYKIFNNNIIEAKYFGIYINENNKNKLIEINKLLNNEIKSFYHSQNINENIDNSDKDNSNKDIIIKKLNDEIDKLKEKLSRYPLELSKGEELISLIFNSLEENMYFSIICKNTEKFVELEKKYIYNVYPKYSQSNNYFMANGIIVDKNKSLNENKIKNNDIIMLAKNII